MIAWITRLPVWELIRISGFVSYLLLLAGISLGILYGYPIWKGKTKQQIFKLHQLAANTGTLIALIHSVLPVISPFMPFHWSEVLIPFAAKDHPILNGIGTIAAYALLLLLLTSDIRQMLGRKLWLALHMLSYPMFIIVWIHGYFEGTDTNLLGVRWMYLLSIVLVVALTFGRMLLPKPAPRAKESPAVRGA